MFAADWGIGWIFVATLLLVSICVELGYRWAAANQARDGREKEAPVGALVGATLGLLAFLLAFTFGMAANRFDVRRQAALDEANSIGTAFLRADFLQTEDRDEARNLLKAYVHQRLQWTGVEHAEHKASVDELHRGLWRTARKAATVPSPITALYVASINDVIDLHSKRLQARERSGIPLSFWGVMYLVAILALTAMGYHSGVSGTARSPVMLAVAIAFSAVILLIVDLDRPGEGLIVVSQQALLDELESMNEMLETPPP